MNSLDYNIYYDKIRIIQNSVRVKKKLKGTVDPTTLDLDSNRVLVDPTS